MSDYIPTTEEVRGFYSCGEPDEILEFDRWLAKHDREIMSSCFSNEDILAFMAKAWEEGAQAGWERQWQTDDEIEPNPYRKGE